MSGLEPFEVPGLPPGQEQAHDRALRRIGWALLALNEGKYRMAERHLADATVALQNLQHMTGGNDDEG